MASSDIHFTFFLGATGHLTNNTIIKITWKNDEPIWTEQWPLTKEKLRAEKALAPHSSTLAWKIPWTEEPGRLQSMGSLRVGHD